MYTETVLEQIVDRKNLNQAFKQVRRNKGAEGVDGMTIEETASYITSNRKEIVTQIRNRKYKPSPVLRVEIPKPTGGVRLLGIPTVKDRVIQQAISQVISPKFDKEFSPYSYGFRPNKQAEMAIQQSLDYFNEGYEWVVDIDLERFFDTVNHDRLMNLISRVIKDGDVISLIRKFLVSGVQVNGQVKPTDIGTPQGGNLSPLLSNIMLNELDKELEARQLHFVRYADDCLIMVKSEMSARRVMRSVTKFIEEKLGLIVNVTKSKIIKAGDSELKYLGFSFYKGKDGYQARPHQASVESFKFKLKRLTRKNWSVSIEDKIKRLNQVILGWINYFKIGKMKKNLSKIESHLRFRVRMCLWKQWKTAQNRRKNLIKLGMDKYTAYKYSHTSKGVVRIAYSWVMTTTMTNKRVAELGLISCVEHYSKVHS
ncbi:group II intron reverse transcriptase/maturase [Vagococcus hydrophili]|uniref:RNA-directed DNA polymerase n=1 Tax=Vagococcus hydrophili TaxID=2714947 RepID=A0A6G8AS49_9ENTE|nr:group II intron reverse transcriptase/maturase [Vagococcus hydrophili]QIL47242.1 group II intron reverse transcriptase/maturase [Vagococcus hydrophili]QIL47826.1 group II intron reverse transcriptase/maturase [Vagococcus hydrophili]QIL48511.1 group II intron reverse transcriptase/maturase [Vagococcus hydrophili]QIL48544.1 group II intron reverse transcriptase/maturase [Vagococcus hydrophili]